jgi:CubicO group peptidase (beta-lactamase class C family)
MKSNSKITYILILCACLFMSTAQKVSAQMSAVYADTLEQTLISIAAANELKGVASAVVFPDGSTWSSATGAHGDEDLTTDLLFDIGSNTKSMVSAIILLLEEEEEVSVDDTLYKYIDVIPNVPYGITLKDLLEMRSGLYDYTWHPDFVDAIFDDTEFIWHPDTILTYFLDEPLFDSGEGWTYCNTNFILLGKVIEEIEGLPLNEVLYNRLFSVFDLENMYLDAYDTYELDITGAYLTSGSYWDNNFLSLKSTAWAAGAVVATPDDLASWCYQLFSGNILSESSMTKLKEGTNFGGGNIYGKGVERIVYNGRPYMMHGGTTLQNSEMHYSIESDFSVVTMDLDQGAYEGTLNVQEALIDVLEFAVADAVASVQEDIPSFSMMAYPNPSNNQINVRISTVSDDASIWAQVFDASGKLIEEKQFENNQLILDKREYGTGLFVLKILSENTYLGSEKVVFCE